MALSYKARRRWSLLILIIGLPAYAVLAVNLMALLPVLPKVLEFILYVVLGTAWATWMCSRRADAARPERFVASTCTEHARNQ